MSGGGQAIAPIEGRRRGQGRGKIALTLWLVWVPHCQKYWYLSPDALRLLCFHAVHGEHYIPDFQQGLVLPLLLGGEPGLSFDRPGLCRHTGGNFSELTLKTEDRLLGQQTLPLSPLFISCDLSHSARRRDNLPFPLRTSNWQHSHITSLDLFTVNLHKWKSCYQVWKRMWSCYVDTIVITWVMQI